MGMKLSVSLPERDVAFLDDYAGRSGMGSRSAALQRAVDVLRLSALGPAYSEAWADWKSSGDGEVWDAAAGDGLSGGSDVPR